MACGATGCPRCEQLPDVSVTDWGIHIWPPLGHSAGKVREALRRHEVAVREDRETGSLRLELHGREALQVMEALAASLSFQERRGTRVLALREARPPAPTDYPRVDTLHGFLSLLRAEPLIAAVRDHDIAADFVPVAHADNLDEVAAHQAAIRLPRLEMPVSEAFALAEDADLMFQLDRACRVTAIRQAAAHGITTPLFVEFHPSAIYDPAYCLRDTVAAVEDAGFEPDSVIFTLSQPGRTHDVGHVHDILDYYRDRGFRVALGHLGSGLWALDLLHRLRPEFAWLSPRLVDGVHADPYRGVIARKVLEIAHRLHIETVAMAELSDDDCEWLYEHGTSYIARPVLARAAPAANRAGGQAAGRAAGA